MNLHYVSVKLLLFLSGAHRNNFWTVLVYCFDHQNSYVEVIFWYLHSSRCSC